MTDEYLMLCVKTDDLDKAAILYERYKKRLFNYFLCKNNFIKLGCEDAVHQVFFRVIKYRKSFKEDGSFSNWIYGIAKNVLNDVLKDKIGDKNIEISFSGNTHYDSINDDYEALRKSIELLPDSYKEIFLMAKFMDMKYEEIAKIKNCSEGVIKTKVFRAMTALRKIYFKIS
jgi:RNA polymerase sigma factor (sigma-70 family)